MMKLEPGIAVAGVVLSFVAAGFAADCAALFAEHRHTDMQLSYQQFDQTMGAGFRVLAEAGCDKQAADLIEEYIRVTGAKQNSLRWHVAQLRATQGDYAEAIKFARTVLLTSEEDKKNPLRWNDYVLATIAFLEHDRPSLLRHRESIAAARDYAGNAVNLRLVDSLVRNFDKDYQYATSHIEPQDPKR